MRSRGFFVLALFLAVWLSLGVSPQTLKQGCDQVVQSFQVE